MSLGSTFANDLAKLILNATAITGIARDAASPLTDYYLSLHTANPVAGDQTTSEIAFTGYARVAVERTGDGWIVTANVASPAADIVFAAMTGGAGGTVTYLGIGTDVSGAGKLLLCGAVTPTLAVTTGITPRIDTDTTLTFA